MQRRSKAILYNEFQEMLIVRQEGRKTYMLPGGKRNRNETARMTLNRELREEIGYFPIGKDLIEVDKFYMHRRFRLDEDFDVTIYRGEIKKDLVSPQGEIVETVWAKDIWDFPLSTTTKRILRYVHLFRPLE